MSRSNYKLLQCVNNNRLAITLMYAPKFMVNANFNVVIAVSRKFNLLSMNVKAISYANEVRLSCENSQGTRIALSSVGLNAINLGDVSTPCCFCCCFYLTAEV